MGALYLNAQGPIAATSSAGSKEGKACAKSYPGMFAMSDASIQAARTAGGIEEVSSVDHSSSNILGLVAEFCPIVRGN